MSLPKLKKALEIKAPETKVYDTLTTGNITTSLTGFLAPITMAQGLTNITRLGRSITLKSMKVRMNLIPDPTATDPGEVRVVYWLQKYPNGNLLTGSEILQTVNNIQSFYQFDTSGYRILYDKTFSFSMADFRNKYIKFNLPVKGQVVEWTEADTTGNINNTTQGYIRGAIMYANFGGTVPSFDSWCRVIYTDS